MPHTAEQIPAPPRRRVEAAEIRYLRGLRHGLFARNYAAFGEDSAYFAGYLRGKKIRLGTPILRYYRNYPGYRERVLRKWERRVNEDPEKEEE